MNQKELVSRVKSFGVKHSGKILAATAAVTAVVGHASAMSAGDISNGSALFAAGIAVAQTEPLGTIISMFAVIIGGLGFIKMVKRLY